MASRTPHPAALRIYNLEPVAFLNHTTATDDQDAGREAFADNRGGRIDVDGVVSPPLKRAALDAQPPDVLRAMNAVGIGRNEPVGAGLATHLQGADGQSLVGHGND